ncbi:MAG: hypothetical protein Q9225_003120 [Loekoesia sp. 1 TL-2023]
MRQACAIHSATAGSILSVPREGRINRMYIQLGLEDNVTNRDQITPGFMLEAARKIMAPYTLDFKYCDWWSLIFLAGDSVHTHSPKLGQGMNVSMQDTYNLVWKLGSVITGVSPRSILSTYQTERRQVALDLLECDRNIARFYARQKPKPTSNGALTDGDNKISDHPDFGAMRERMHEFLAGVGIRYEPSVLVASSYSTKSTFTPPEHIHLGVRIPSYKIINQSEARPVQLHHILKSDGRWRLLIFAGNISIPAQHSRLLALCQLLNPRSNPASILRTYTPPEKSIDHIIEVATIHAAKRTDVELLRDFPEILHPWEEDLGWDYWKVFVDDEAHHEGFADAYGNLGIDREKGCLVLCRPDQHVAWMGALEDVEGLERVLRGALVKQQG